MPETLKAGGLADFQNAHVGGFEQACGDLNPVPGQVIDKGHADGLFEERMKMTPADMNHLARVINAQRAHVILLNVLKDRATRW